MLSDENKAQEQATKSVKSTDLKSKEDTDLQIRESADCSLALQSLAGNKQARYFLDKPCVKDISDCWNLCLCDILSGCAIQVSDDKLPDKIYLVFFSHSGNSSKNLLTKKEFGGKILYVSGKMRVNLLALEWACSGKQYYLCDEENKKLTDVKIERVFSIATHDFANRYKMVDDFLDPKINWSAPNIALIRADVNNPLWHRDFTHITWKAKNVPFKVFVKGENADIPLIEIKDALASYVLKLLTGNGEEFDFGSIDTRKMCLNIVTSIAAVKIKKINFW